MTDSQVKTNSLKAWILAARPKTLSGAAVPVMIGAAAAYTTARENFQWLPTLLCFLFAFIMQIDSNFINDYFDCIKGNDDKETRLGPKRACSEGWITLHAMRIGLVITSLLGCLVGLPLVFYGGYNMIIVGTLCVLFAFLYTTKFSYLGLGDVLVLVFFGIVPVCTTYYVQLHTMSWQVFLASIACGLVIDGLLMVNNYRDRENDERSGKRTLVVEIGATSAEHFYLWLGITAPLLGITFWVNGHVLAFILPIIYLLLHTFTWLKMKRIHHGRELNICLEETARNMLIYGFCVSIGLLL
jgi:1,4-dihydroxy-2-naphthoate octaprenyltransferase